MLVILLYKNFTEAELSGITNGFEIGFYFFTISIGALGLIKYWDSVETKRNETNWTKYKILDEKYNDFVKANSEIISSFEWEHKFDLISEICDKEKKYRKLIEKGEKPDFNEGDIEVIEKLDRFLDFFENLYYAIDKNILEYNDLQIFFHYHIITLSEYATDKKYKSFQDYIKKYYFNINSFLKEYMRNIKT